jgi:hypothetical protein
MGSSAAVTCWKGLSERLFATHTFAVFRFTGLPSLRMTRNG